MNLLRKINETLETSLQIGSKLIKLTAIVTGFYYLKKTNLLPDKIQEKKLPEPNYMKQISKNLPFDIICEEELKKPKIKVSPYIITAGTPLLKSGRNWYMKRYTNDKPNFDFTRDDFNNDQRLIHSVLKENGYKKIKGVDNVN